MRLCISALLVLLLTACGTRPEHDSAQYKQPKIIVTKGNQVPKSSIEEPSVIPVDENKLKTIELTNPKVVKATSNVHVSGEPLVVELGLPTICIPGQDSFLLPVQVPAMDSVSAAGIPETVIAKDAYTKDPNPQSFSVFGKRQGLKYSSIRCLFEDRLGNLWIGTNGGGVTKYDGQNFIHFTYKEGLSSNLLRSIIQDRNGNLWFGMGNGGGVVRYDGRNFAHFNQKNGLSGNNVLSILEDHSGNIWFGTSSGGISKYDGSSFMHFTKKQGLPDNRVNCILEDSSGNLWLGTEEGLSKYDGKSFSNYTISEGLANNDIQCITQDSTGNIWFGTDGGGVTKLSKEDAGGTDRFIMSHFSMRQGMSSNKVLFIKQDRDGHIWFGTDGGGVSKFSQSIENGKNSYVFSHYTEGEGLSDNQVWSILQDKNGNLWFGTNDGLCRYQGQLFTHLTEKEGLLSAKVFSMLRDNSGLMWFGTDVGISKYDGEYYTHFKINHDENDFKVNSILQDRNGNLWFGTYGAGVLKYNGKFFTAFTMEDGIPRNHIYSIVEDKSGNLWFGTNGGGVTKYDGRNFTLYNEKNGLSKNIIRSILQDASGNLWFGTWGGGLTRYNGEVFTHFNEGNGLSSNGINSLIRDERNSIWVGTDGGGVLKIDEMARGSDEYVITNLSESQGLTNNNVNSIFEDSFGNIWFGTRFGLNKIESEKCEAMGAVNNGNDIINYSTLFNRYQYEDGFLGVGVYIGSTMTQDRRGNIWIGSDDRITVFHSEALSQDTIAPVIQLSAVDLFNESIAWPQLAHNKDTTFALKNGIRFARCSFSDVSRWYGVPENLSLAYNNNYLTFNFIGITKNQPNQVRYQYKLEGLDENWSGITGRNEATYGNLPHGTYTFLVKAMNSEGIWSAPLRYTFTIRPPWWKTWWAYALGFIIVIVAITIYLRWRDRTAILRRKVLLQKVNEATTEIRNQKELVEKQKEEVETQKEEVERQKQRSDELLLNILPEQVADELKERGQAEAKLIENVTVLFTDFKGFTQLSEKLSPQVLVSQIHEYFSAFDDIIGKYGIEKIKTIGDAYMAAGGLPEKNRTHASDVVSAAIEINGYIKEQRKIREARGESYFEIRIGVHTGPVVAGIVGVKKFQYDIWGDTVNTASRMESAGEPGKINISERTHELIKDQIKCEYRGEIEVKGKGKMRMYFVSHE